MYSFLNKMSCDQEESETGPVYEMINKENSAPLYDIVEKESKDNIAVTDNCCYVSNITMKQPTTKNKSWPITSKITHKKSISRRSTTLTLLSFIFGILIVILTTTTLVGFLRKSMTESDKHVAAIKPDLCHNISFNKSVTLIPQNETLDQTISSIQLLIQHNYSHLQNLFYDNNYLLSLLSECIKRSHLSFVQCSDSSIHLFTSSYNVSKKLSPYTQ